MNHDIIIYKCRYKCNYYHIRTAIFLDALMGSFTIAEIIILHIDMQ